MSKNEKLLKSLVTKYGWIDGKDLESFSIWAEWSHPYPTDNKISSGLQKRYTGKFRVPIDFIVTMLLIRLAQHQNELPGETKIVGEYDR